MLKISSLQNTKIKDIVKLRDRKARDESSLFLIEGYREIRRAVDAKWPIEMLFYCPSFFLGKNEPILLKDARAELIECSEEVFQKIAYRDRPDGLLALAPQKSLQLADLQLPQHPFLLIAESIEKPGNLGTMLRSADAAGVHAVIVADPTTDIYNPNVVRSSVGTLFTLPVLSASNQDIFSFLQTHKINIVAATPHAEKEYTQQDLKPPVAIVVGTEQYGLSETWLNQATLKVRIPMYGIADSLNVASAATLLLYEVVRQHQYSLRR